MQKAFEKATRKILDEENRRAAIAKAAGIGKNIRWNTLTSRLVDNLKQGRGRNPPEQYRRAIERYFELLSQESDSPPR